MATNFDIPQTPQQVQDYQKILIRSVGLQNAKTLLYKPGMPDYPGKDPELYKSQLGTNVMSNLEIKGQSYRYKQQTYSFEDIRIDTVLFRVEQQKNIVQTPIQGRNGTVKQYISDKDYLVTINGIITGLNGIFPIDGFVNLLKVIKAPIAIHVNSWFLQHFDIYNLVVESYQINQNEGGQSYQIFQLICLSDEPVEIKLK
jgi:hypothetical protein